MRPYQVPVEEIKLAAKAGFLTKSLWKKHFCKTKRSAAYKRWRGFIERGIFIPFGRGKNHEIVKLNPKSKYVIPVVGMDISMPPIPYQIHHDSLVIDIVMDLINKGKIQEYFLEPEIKRHLDLFDLNKATKLPDAIAVTNEGKFAIEVELSKKAQKRYYRALEFYASSDIFDEVYYLSNSPGIQKQLARIARKIKYPQQERPLRFGVIAA